MPDFALDKVTSKMKYERMISRVMMELNIAWNDYNLDDDATLEIAELQGEIDAKLFILKAKLASSSR